MRLIDADALMEAFREYMAKKHDREKCISEENCNACDRGCLWRKIVVNAPTIDVASLRPTGEWVFDHVTGVDKFEVVKCSNCEYEAYAKAIHVRFGNFCPNCGAKMKGEK